MGACTDLVDNLQPSGLVIVGGSILLITATVIFASWKLTLLLTRCLSCLLVSPDGRLSDASMCLAVKWEGLFPPEEPKFVDWYWSSMAAVLTSLELSIDVDEVHKGISATLCQLTRLERLGLADAPGNIAQTALEPMATLSLDLPLLEWLEITEVDLGLIKLSCPKLVELVLENVLLMGFRGMPDSIQKVSLTLSDGSVPLQEIIPAHSAKSLEELLVLTNATHCEGEIGQGFTDPEVVKEVCLNGKLRRLVMEDVSFHAGAFSVAALWQAIPHTLEDVSLELALDEGIPRILEELINLTALCPEHAGGSCMHLDRPLDPFLDMLRLESLQLLSCWNRGLLDGTGMRMWSPPALRFLGLAEKRIRQMQLTPPGRSISLTY